MREYGYNLDQKRVKALSELQPWRTAAAIALDWATIAAAIAFSEWMDTAWALVLAWMVIGGRMHAMGVLIHDFAHYRFIPNKKASEWVGDVLLAWPLLTFVDGYRKNHLAHHRYTNTEKDPDWKIKLGTRHFTFPQSWQYAIMNLLGYLVGISSYRDMKSIVVRLSDDEGRPLHYQLKRFGFYIAMAFVFFLTGAWHGFVLYWLLPFFTFMLLFLYIRSVAEHFGSMDYESELGSSRTVYPYLWERAFFAPHNVNYHLDHHLYPSVPFYNLPKLHAALMADPEFAAGAHITRGYSTGLVRECLAPAPKAQPADNPAPAE
ncbi:fatty acid desaturase family protein [Mesorhizobium australicum]|uniref:Fatty acid desaturase n=1 Tax=Mesorhizobium australicum TaxID=536018 RepID=A0A1X7NTC8_9HYPH|nr:fatty acid desaturase family protein [Mesorhizobium australicum]SMH41507.1 Fatty acid desaturase [Mesorhizobium australicum]